MEPDHRLELIPLRPGQHHVTALPKIATDLPFFYLTKRREALRRAIQFDGQDQEGRPMHWVVTPNANPAIGAPGIEAHEVWVRLVMPAVTEHRGSDGQIPDIVPLGKLRESLRAVGWAEGGWEARRLLKALRQIGAAWCVADLWMPTSEVDESGKPKFVRLKGEFSRMAIYAIGSKHLTEEQLRDGTFSFDFDLDDTVYVQLHPLELTIQRHQTPRLLDNEYLFSVGPAARRWYELISPKIYGAIMYKRECCEIRYSWYVRHHPTLKRHAARHRVLVQMNRLVEEHVRLGYISRVEYRTVKEPGKEVDYLIRYFPGPAAKQSIERVRKAKARATRTTIDVPMYPDQSEVPIDERHIEESRIRTKPPQPEHSLLPELTRRGILAMQARKILTHLADDQPVIDQLEWGDHKVAQGEIQNPPGFYTYLIRNNVSLPPEFETSRKRKVREETQHATDAARGRELKLEERYRVYVEAETNRHIETNLPEGEYERLLAAKKDELLQTGYYRSEQFLTDMATGAVRSRIKAGIAFTTFEAFRQEEQAIEGQSQAAPPGLKKSTDGRATDADFVV